ncbi:hypothetical protein [Periweissella fabalis]|uniref:PepSY domain-containing protein n=1 Tax=Periweissella fabalis TaxID=1070421 RepID=A0A7X6S3Q5_9LACO|nr:hypothetical protein [Periweissella fabalis]MCM0598824.1 hypothetical protein [Periweissella fabalis]NKZ24486.1 hypothetical protein [Periweissella fabalis]
MNKKGFGIIAGIIGSIGVAAAISSKNSQEKTVAKTHAKLISKIHDEFANSGKIEGTWLNRDTEVYFANNTKWMVYNGGVTLRKNGELEQYRLKIDAKSFAIILQEKIL